MQQQSSPTSSPRLRLFEPYYPLSVRDVIRDMLGRGEVFMGKKVKELEQRISGYLGVMPEQVVAVSSCTAALQLVMAQTPRHGFEVLVPGLTMAATAHAVQLSGNETRVVDVGRDLLISAEICEEAWTERTGAILAVDYAGFMPDYKALQEVAHRHDALVIEDAAHSFGSTMYGQKAGKLADFACFSLYPTKPLQGLGGGIIVNNLVDQPRFHRMTRELRYYGITDRKGCDYDVRHLGGNFYMSDLSAAAALEALKDIGPYGFRSSLEIRQMVAKHYCSDLVERVPWARPMRYQEEAAYHLFPVVLDEGVDRDALQAYLLKWGIETGTHYKPLHWLSLYSGRPKGPTPYLDAIGKRLLTLPCHARMCKQDTEMVIHMLEQYKQGT